MVGQNLGFTGHWSFYTNKNWRVTSLKVAVLLAQCQSWKLSGKRLPGLQQPQQLFKCPSQYAQSSQAAVSGHRKSPKSKVQRQHPKNYQSQKVRLLWEEKGVDTLLVPQIYFVLLLLKAFSFLLFYFLLKLSVFFGSRTDDAPNELLWMKSTINT